MGIAATVSFNVPALANDDIWFLNAAAWSNYWAAVPATIDINAVITAQYIPQAFDPTLPVYDLRIDGVDKNMPSMDLFNSLAIQVQALDGSFQNLKAALKAAGLITN